MVMNKKQIEQSLTTQKDSAEKSRQSFLVKFSFDSYADFYAKLKDKFIDSQTAKFEDYVSMKVVKKEAAATTGNRVLEPQSPT